MIVTSFTVFLFQQKEVPTQMEEEQILSTSEDNIVKVFFKLCETGHTFSSNSKMCACLKEW